MTLFFLCLFFLLWIVTVQSERKLMRPNIVLIVADDLGWNDVSFHGSDQIPTPNIDLLAYSGVALERYYSNSFCTPSRSALLTGKYAHVTGMQGYPLTNGEDRGLPLTEKLLPQYLKELGYATHLVGKWHVGQSRTEYLPTSRGFDSHFWNIGEVSGMDLYRNLSAAWDVEGYITDIYNTEAKSIIRNHDVSKPLFLMLSHNAPHSAGTEATLQAPPEQVRIMRHIELQSRRKYAAMVKKLDDSVGDIIRTLLDQDILNNTIIVFISDNGGMTSGIAMNYASNWPLRGIKMSPFEGGVRLAGLIWSPMLNFSNNLWSGYMHSVDWLPILLGAIGAEPPGNIDGINLLDNILLNRVSDRIEIIDIDDYWGSDSIISGDYKLVSGTVIHNYSDHQGNDLRGIINTPPNYISSLKRSTMYVVLKEIQKPISTTDIELQEKIKVNCNDRQKKELKMCYPEKGKPCLFNIKLDPCEVNDLSKDYPELVANLLLRIETERQRIIPRKKPLHRDVRSAPKLYNYTWTTWADHI